MPRLSSVLQPGRALAVIRAVAKGHWYKFWLPLRGQQFRAGRNFRVRGRLVVRGPGRVIFGDNVLVEMLVTPFTHAAEATIHVGDRVFLNGTRFGCAREIRVGDDCIVAESRIMDTDFHSMSVNRHDSDAPIRVLPVNIGRNVWIAAEVGILPGTTIGENSVVGFGSVCSGRYPSNALIAGNPASVKRAITDAGMPPAETAG